MPSLSLIEAGKIQQNPLIQGIIESIVTVNQMYGYLPFDFIQGNALSYTRELTLGGVESIGIGGGSNTIPAGARTQATFAPVTAALKALIGDAEVDHFVQVTMSGQNDQMAVQVASKAKSLGRKFQQLMITGNATTDPLQFDGLDVLVPTAQTEDAASAAYSFEILDALMSKIVSKDGRVDYIMMPDVAIRKHLQLLRSLGGTTPSDVRTMPDGSQLVFYRETPIFRNDYIPITGTTTKTTTIHAGVFDDGSRKVGVAGIAPELQSGIFLSDLGEKSDTNDIAKRLRFYSGLAVFSQLGVAKATNVKVS